MGNNGNWFYQLVFNWIIRLWYYWLILFLLPIVAWNSQRKRTLSDDNLMKSVLIDFLLSWCIFFIYSAEGCSGQNLSIRCARCGQPNAHNNSDQEHGQHGSCNQTQLCKCQTSCSSKGMVHLKIKILTFTLTSF